MSALENGELYTSTDGNAIAGCVILNSSCNEEYKNVCWKTNFFSNEILVLHALAVAYKYQGSGTGKKLVSEIINFARLAGKKALRLDILAKNAAARRLYTGAGFCFVQSKDMFYEDTGTTKYELYELVL